MYCKSVSENVCASSSVAVYLTLINKQTYKQVIVYDCLEENTPILVNYIVNCLLRTRHGQFE